MADDTRLNDGEGLEIAHSIADFGIERDDSGELKPIKQRIPGTELAVLVRPVVDVEPVADVLEQPNPSDDRVDEVAERHIVEGIGADGTLSDEPDYVITGVLQAIKNSSGKNIHAAVEEQRIGEMKGMMEAFAPEDLERLAQLGNEANSNGQR